MRVCVFGAGAIGGHLAARLARGGAAVSVVARGPHLLAMQQNGLRVEAPDGTIEAAVQATDDPRRLGTQDAVVVTVKAPALPSVAAAIGPLLGPETPVVFVMNGIPWWYFHAHGGPLDGRRLPRIDPGDAIWNAVGPQRAIGGVVNSACTVTAPGVVHVETPRNRLDLGEPDGSASPRAERIAALLQAGGFGAAVTDRIRDRVWNKLLLNLGTGPMAVATHGSGQDVFAEPALRDAAHRVLAEAATIAAALGCSVKPDADALVAGARKLSHKASILQDLELGRPMEIEAIYAAPLELARLCGVAAPILELLVALAAVRARVAGLYAG